MKTMTTVVPATTAFAEELFTTRVETFDCFGPGKIAKAFGVPIEQFGVIPPIPFSEAELTRARELGQYLILQISVGIDGKPLTMQKMHNQRNNKLGDGKLLFAVDWYPNEPFYTTDTPRLGWALVSREVIPGSTGQNYIEQTQAISDYLVYQVFKGKKLPEEYQIAVDEFSNRKEELEKLRDTNWNKCAEECENLKLNQLFREKPVEVLYGLIVQHEVNKERLLENKWNWTNNRSLDGRLVSGGNCGAGGVRVCRDYPAVSGSDLGVRFFRSGSPASVS